MGKEKWGCMEGAWSEDSELNVRSPNRQKATAVGAMRAYLTVKLTLGLSDLESHTFSLSPRQDLLPPSLEERCQGLGAAFSGSLGRTDQPLSQGQCYPSGQTMFLQSARERY